MIILSCDPSYTNTGFCVIDTEYDTKWKTKSVPKLRDELSKEASLNRFYALTKDFIKKFAPDVFGIEAYAFAANTRCLTQLAELGGVIRLAAHQMCVPIIEVSPGTWKKITLGKGNFNKSEIKQEAFKLFPFLKKKLDITQDEIDAFCIAKTIAFAHSISNEDTQKLRKQLGNVLKLSTTIRRVK